MSKQEILEQLANSLVAIERPHPIRVAIDGIDAAGKTTLADLLAQTLEGRGRSVIRASIDDFHRPRAELEQPRRRVDAWQALCQALLALPGARMMPQQRA